MGEAISAANGDVSVDGCAAGSGTDTITIPAGTYILMNGSLPNVTTSIIFEGAGAATTIVERDPGAPNFRILNTGGAAVTVNGLTFRGGNAPSAFGGAIFSGGLLQINLCVFENNSGNSGGAIYNSSGFETAINDSLFTNNSSTIGDGGAESGSEINVRRSRFTGNSASTGGGAITGFYIYVEKSTISNNTVGNGGGGGVLTVATFGTYLIIEKSTISGNTATGNGGGLALGTITVNNSTISGNRSDGSGGGIMSGNGIPINLNNVTVTNNIADNNNDSVGRGGGIGFSGNTNFRNSIIAGNINTDAPDCVSFSGSLLSGGYNIIGDDQLCNLVAAVGDQVGTSGSPINPILGLLADNGDETFTHALLAGSPAIDTANPAIPDGMGGNCHPTDQRFVTRPSDGDNNGSLLCDIGAYEIASPTAANVAVSGRILTANGTGIRNVLVTLTDTNGNTQTTFSSSFGHYVFENVSVGATYILSVRVKKYQFSDPTVVLFVADEISNANFVADDSEKSILYSVSGKLLD